MGAISTIVGGYVGLKIGASGKDDAVQGQRDAEQAKDAAKSDVAILLGKLEAGEADEIKEELASVPIQDLSTDSP